MKKESLFILPFDHRSSFLEKMFEIEGRPASSVEIEKIKEFKKIIYLGFKWAIENEGLPKDSAAILVDDQFGEAVIKEALADGYTVCVSTEKSGQNEFEFEYGNDFGQHLDIHQPSFAKALVRYNPKGDQKLNARQREKLKRLSDFCKKRGYGFIIEPLVLETDEQMKRIGNDKKRYDNELRPDLMIEMIKEMRGDGIAPDTWKIEGLESPDSYRALVEAIGPSANAIILGRGADDAQVERWLIAGAKVKGIIGFAIGRTIFWDPLTDFKKGKIGKDVAIKRIGEKYKKFYDVFVKAKNERNNY